MVAQKDQLDSPKLNDVWSPELESEHDKLHDQLARFSFSGSQFPFLKSEVVMDAISKRGKKKVRTLAFLLPMGPRV